MFIENQVFLSEAFDLYCNNDNTRKTGPNGPWEKVGK